MKLKRSQLILSVSLAIAATFFFFSFTQFQVELRTQEIVEGNQVFVSTEKTAVDEFLEILEEQNRQNNLDKSPDKVVNQGFGLGIFVDFRDSDGKIIPQEGKFLKIPFSDTSVFSTVAQSLVGQDGQLLDFAKIQFDVLGIAVLDTKVQVTAKYSILSNNQVIISGTIFGNGPTTDKKINLNFEQGQKKGDAIELNFENGEIPVNIGHNTPITNTLEFRISEVEAIIGEGFNTDRYYWKGTFPVYTLKYDADDATRTVRDYRGIAIQTLPNDVGLQVCGLDNGRFISGGGFGRHAPTIEVKKENTIVLTSSQPAWGNRDADFNSHKCSSIVSGLERNTSYIFIVDGTPINVMTPETPILYKADCKRDSNEKEYCTSNFGWSK